MKKVKANFFLNIIEDKKLTSLIKDHNNNPPKQQALLEKKRQIHESLKNRSKNVTSLNFIIKNLMKNTTPTLKQSFKERSKSKSRSGKDDLSKPNLSNLNGRIDKKEITMLINIYNE